MKNLMNYVGEEETDAGCKACYACLACFGCLSCLACLIPLIGQAATVASAIDLAGGATGLAAGVVGANS